MHIKIRHIIPLFTIIAISIFIYLFIYSYYLSNKNNIRKQKLIQVSQNNKTSKNANWMSLKKQNKNVPKTLTENTHKKHSINLT